ncbi:MAG: hypothetical protein HY075_11925 [Deltaproteobacteria bacterium]|nr:hypothetical protein [Deltaproteobacteria bacterium]
MSAKIERVSGTAFGTAAIKRKESADQQGSANQQKKEQQQQKPDEEQQPPADRQTVEKAMADLRSSDNFTQTGMRVEVLNTKEGLRVRLAQANGSVVKVMSAEEFMKLRDSTAGVNASPGKILDQKV